MAGGDDRLELERAAEHRGFVTIAGVDEVGRAAWAGPMVAAAVILGREFDPTGIRSSKKMKAKARDEANHRIREEARAVAVWHVEPSELDERGFDECHMDLLRRAVAALEVEPEFVLVDHYTIPELKHPQEPVTRGDDISASIGAASIVAKVVCDQIMLAYHEAYPAYGFARNKGYRSEEHVAALERFGPCPIHRRSVSPLRKYVSAG
jgi:ribonuclease HII